MVGKRAFSLYDIEQFLREAGAEKINERAVISLEKELQDTVKELVSEAAMYANYAGRKHVIKLSDIHLANGSRKSARYMNGKQAMKRMRSQINHNRQRAEAQKIMLINNMPVVKAAYDITEHR